MDALRRCAWSVHCARCNCAGYGGSYCAPRADDGGSVALLRLGHALRPMYPSGCGGMCFRRSRRTLHAGACAVRRDPATRAHGGRVSARGELSQPGPTPPEPPARKVHAATRPALAPPLVPRVASFGRDNHAGVVTGEPDVWRPLPQPSCRVPCESRRLLPHPVTRRGVGRYPRPYQQPNTLLPTAPTGGRMGDDDFAHRHPGMGPMVVPPP